MRLELKKLKSNPLRDFTVDPIDEENVKRLTKSIKEDGFWGGVVVRKRSDNYEIAAGQHRVKAAMRAGITHADLFVMERGQDTDEAMIRIYARENATQRGNTATAATGTVAATIRFILRDVLSEGVSGKFTGHSLVVMKAQIESSKGLGRDAIHKFLEDIPGVSIGTIKEQLASLKASGDYARIVGEVRKEIEESGAEEAVIASAQRAAESASRTPRTFDFTGAAEHLRNDSQLRTFRDVVTGEGVTPYLPVNRQAALARRLVNLAEENDQELSSRFIRENVTSMVLSTRQAERTLSREERRRIEERDIVNKAKGLMHEFSQQVNRVTGTGTKLSEVLKDWPSSIPLTVTAEFKEAIKTAKLIINKLSERI